MYRNVLSLMAGGLVTIGALASWSAAAAADEPQAREPLKVQPAMATSEAGSVPIQLVDHRRHRRDRGFSVSVGIGTPGYYYPYGYSYYPSYSYYDYPRYRYYSYPRRYYVPYGYYNTSYYDPYYGSVYYRW